MKHRNMAIGGLVVLAAAIMTFGALYAAGVDLGGSSSAEHAGGGDGPGLLLSSNRDSLQVCVEFLDVDLRSEEAVKAFENVEAAVSNLAAHPYWSEKLGLTDFASTAKVDAGCPSGVPKVRPGSGPPIARVQGHEVQEASKYRKFVFIMPDEEAVAFVGDYWTHNAMQEYTCFLDDCGGVTGGVYVGVSEAGDVQRLTSILHQAIGLPQ